MKVFYKLYSKNITRSSVLVMIILFSLWIGSKLGEKKSAPHTVEHTHTSEEQVESTTWTCSMHPQIKMNKPGKCPLCFMDLIPLVTSSSRDETSSDVVRLSMSENAKIFAGITTAPVQRRQATSDLRLSGKVAFDETRVELITARIPGRIDRLYVDYTGIPVKIGDHLAQLYSPDLLSLQQELLQAANALKGTSPETSDMVRHSITTTFNAGKEKMRLLGFSDTELKEILDRGTTSDHMMIRAGQSGIVLNKLIEKGAYVQTGTPLFHIGDLSSLWILLDAYESDLALIRLGQEVAFTAEAFPGQTFRGGVSFIDPVINPQTRTIKVRVEVPNKDYRLKPDMFVKASIKVPLSGSGSVLNGSLRGKWISPMHPQIVKDHPGTCDICGMPLVRAEELGYVTSGASGAIPLVVPSTAILFTGERSLVYVEVPGSDEPTYEAREVVTGPRVNDYYIISSGVSEGEMVVVNGAFRIDAELQIRGKPSMMNPKEKL
jgi:Cu(I)/Ag(I) efflux system membrane fusion protein